MVFVEMAFSYSIFNNEFWIWALTELLPMLYWYENCYVSMENAGSNRPT